MTFWASIIGYHIVWFAAVIGASHGVVWPALLALLLYGAVQLTLTHTRRADLFLAVTGVLMGFLLDGVMAHARLATYDAAWPSTGLAPVWILALWAAFSMTFTKSLVYLQKRLWLGAVFGAIGGPLAYWGASGSFHVVRFADPSWHALLWLATGWSLATPALAWLSARWSRVANPALFSLQEGAS